MVRVVLAAVGTFRVVGTDIPDVVVVAGVAYRTGQDTATVEEQMGHKEACDQAVNKTWDVLTVFV